MQIQESPFPAFNLLFKLFDIELSRFVEDGFLFDLAFLKDGSCLLLQVTNISPLDILESLENV
jgi:hypothetical protein